MKLFLIIFPKLPKFPLISFYQNFISPWLKSERVCKWKCCFHLCKIVGILAIKIIKRRLYCNCFFTEIKKNKYIVTLFFTGITKNLSVFICLYHFHFSSEFS